MALECEQYASEGPKKSDWTDKRAVTEEQGRELADEPCIKFMAKINGRGGILHTGKVSLPFSSFRSFFKFE